MGPAEFGSDEREQPATYSCFSHLSLPDCMIHGRGIWDLISGIWRKEKKARKSPNKKSPTPFAWVISQP